MNCLFARRSRRSRSGVVLIVVLVAIVMLSLAGYTFSQLMFAEREAAFAHGQGMQAQALAHSGVAWVEQQLVQSPATLAQQGGWYDNPGLFRGVAVTNGDLDPALGRFTVISTRQQNGMPVGVRYGLEDESARLNLNTLLLLDQAKSGQGAQALMMLPGMTPDVADAILDWMDLDDTARQNGAERDYYSALSPSYAPKNGPLESVEELLLVRGVTPYLLFGADADRNGLIDARENLNVSQMGAPPTSGTLGGSSNANASGGSGSSSGGSSSSGSSSSGAPATNPFAANTSQGWASYLTVYSMESNLRPDGQLKINLNSTDLNQLQQDLSSVLDPDMATYIIAYRQGTVSGRNYGQQMPSTPATPAAQPIGGRQLDLTKPGPNKFASPLDLVGSSVQVAFQGSTQPSAIASPFDPSPAAIRNYLPKLLDYTTTTPAPTVPGRININLASPTVLMTIPNLDAQTVERILNTRTTDPSQLSSDRQYAAWLYVDGLVDLNTMKQIMPYITSSGRVFRAQIAGFYDRPGPTCRIEAVVDATSQIPRLLFWRDLSHLGRGFGPSVLGGASTR
jgi:type II secretory pathway component PulK